MPFDKLPLPIHFIKGDAEFGKNWVVSRQGVVIGYMVPCSLRGPSLAGLPESKKQVLKFDRFETKPPTPVCT